jgi:hypothetical protein
MKQAERDAREREKMFSGLADAFGKGVLRMAGRDLSRGILGGLFGGSKGRR